MAGLFGVPGHARIFAIQCGSTAGHDRIRLQSGLAASVTVMSKKSGTKGSQASERAAVELVAEAERLVAARKFARAVECMDDALKSRPDELEWLRRRGDILRISARFTEAQKDYQRLIDLSPEDADGWLELGHCYYALGLEADAERAFLRALDIAPRSLQAMVSLGAAYRQAGSYEPAIRWLEKAVAVNPSEVRAHCLLGTALLAAGKADKARISLEQAFRLNPYDRTTLAYFYVALCQTGDNEAATALADPEHLVRSYQYSESAAPPGSGESLNERLAKHVRTHPSLEFERSGNTTRGGGHTGNLLEDSPGPVGELFAWIDARIRQYFAELPKSASHPFLAWAPERWDIDAWGVVIQPGGYQEPHIHSDGWLSGVYYVSVPEEVLSQGDDTQGCLELGTPPAAFCDRGEFPTQCIRPRPGKLNIFPSFVWHRTFPYESIGERICIAFDVRPRN